MFFYTYILYTFIIFFFFQSIVSVSDSEEEAEGEESEDEQQWKKGKVTFRQFLKEVAQLMVWVEMTSHKPWRDLVDSYNGKLYIFCYYVVHSRTLASPSIATRLLRS